MDRRFFLGATTAGLGTLGGPLVASARSETAQSGIADQPLDARSKHPAVATEALATHAATIRFEDLDAQTVRKAKHRVLDLIGCAIGGARATGNPALVDVMKLQGGTPECSVIGYPVKLPAMQAAMTNAVISRAYDFEVMYAVVESLQVASHHSPTTCMTALALAERGKRSGKEFLTALVLGDDICARMLAASGLDFGQGWDGAPIYSAMGATAIAAHLLRLTPQQAQDAFGLALNTIAGTVQNIWDGATDWKLPQGLAARNGIFAAELALRGWVGVSDAMQAPYGFYTQYTAGCARPELLTRNLGDRFYAEEYYKPYPACAATHATIECALALKQSQALTVDDIAHLDIRLPKRALSVFVAKPFEVRRYPHCDANFSHQWQAATALLRGPVRQEHYEASALSEPKLLALIARTGLSALPDGQTGIEIAAQLSDGRRLVQRHSGAPLHYPAERGSTYEDITRKFYQQVAFAGFVNSSTADQIVERIDNLEKETDVSAFIRLVTTHHLPPGYTS